MKKYIFLDNWVYSLLIDVENERRLSAFLRQRGFTILATTLSFIELYNPNWEQFGEKDRMYKAANFLSNNPSVIVSPRKVIKSEINSYPEPLPFLPIELELENISECFRATTLLLFFKGDKLFDEQDISIENWRDQYEKAKAEWFTDVENIIEKACQDGYLRRDDRGNFIDLQKDKELFLLSLEFRIVEADVIDTLLLKLVERAKIGEPIRLTAMRLNSLCFWYSYINIDPSNKTKRKGSDIGDFYQLSLLPYCSAFTTDGSMYRMLKRIKEPIIPTTCDVITCKMLLEILSDY